MPAQGKRFRKFAETEKNLEDNEIETVKSKSEKKEVKLKYPSSNRKTKDLVYKDCKFDLKHLFYVNHRVQRYIPHSLLPNLTLEDCPVENGEDLLRYNYPYYTMDEPFPVYIARKHCERVDPCFKRPIARNFHRSRLSYAHTSYQNALKSNRKLRKMEKDHVYYPSLFTFAERLECDPDPYFYGSYDYYYTGGNLCVLSNEDEFVIHVDDISLGTIRASTVSFDKDNNISLKQFATKKIPYRSEIFQIIPLKNINSKMQNIVGVRQRNSINLLKILPETKEISLAIEFKTNSTPFISFAQSSDNPEMFVVTTMKDNIRVYDINQKDVQIINRFTTEKEKNHINWNTIQYWNNQSFLFANERQLSIMDFRTPKENWKKACCTFSSDEFPCEFISSLARSQFDNLFYVGSTHKLRCVDARFLGKNKSFDYISVCEWTHQLDYPPLLMDIHHTNKRESIAIASPIAGDLRLCEITRFLNADNLKESFYKSYCLPWQPPTLQEAYSNACLAGNALQPEADFKHRMRACTTGLSFYKSKTLKNRKLLLLSSNSNGDVYAQTMEKRSADDPDPEQRISGRCNEVMAAYAAKVCELTQPDLNYTDVTDFKVMKKILLSTALSSKLVKAEENPVQQNEKPDLKLRFKGRWQKSMNTLYSYKDVLAQDLLSIWDVPREDEIDIKYSELKKKFKMEKDSKDILNWLENYQTTAPNTSIPTTSVPSSNLKRFLSEEDRNENLTFVNASQPNLNETDVTHISTSGFEYSMQEDSFVAKKPKLAKPKKKHVKGF